MTLKFALYRFTFTSLVAANNAVLKRKPKRAATCFGLGAGIPSCSRVSWDAGAFLFNDKSKFQWLFLLGVNKMWFLTHVNVA